MRWLYEHYSFDWWKLPYHACELTSLPADTVESTLLTTRSQLPIKALLRTLGAVSLVFV